MTDRTNDQPPRLSIEVEVDSDEERSALRGALLAAQANELAELRRRDDRLSFGYGSESAQGVMSDDIARHRLRYEMLGRLLAALEVASTTEGD